MLHLRNVDVDPAEPLESWPFEALVTLIERGTVTDLARLTRAIGLDPWGPVTRQVEEYLGYASPAGVGPCSPAASAGLGPPVRRRSEPRSPVRLPS